MVSDLWIWAQIIFIIVLVIGVPASLIIGVLLAIDSMAYGRMQRYVRSPEKRRRTNGSVLAQHIGKNVRN